MNQDKITLIRYVRKNSENWEQSNLGGATLAFEIDYQTRMVKVAASVCSEEDNFDKTLGAQFAKQRLNDPDQCTQFQYDYVDHFKGLVNACTVTVMEDFIESEQTGIKSKVPEMVRRAVILRDYYSCFTDKEEFSE